MKTHDAVTQSPPSRRDAENGIVGAVTEILRCSPARRALSTRTGLTLEEIESLLSSSGVRNRVMESAAAFVVEQLPIVLNKIAQDANATNHAAWKMIVELSGVSTTMDALASPAASEPGQLLEQGLLQGLRDAIAQLRDSQTRTE